MTTFSLACGVREREEVCAHLTMKKTTKGRHDVRAVRVAWARLSRRAVQEGRTRSDAVSLCKSQTKHGPQRHIERYRRRTEVENGG